MVESVKSERGIDAYLFPLVFASLCWVTLEGETEAAILACCDASADCTTGGMPVPAGKERPSAHRTRIANKPERGLGFPSG